MRLIFTLIPLIFIGCIPNRLVPHSFSIEKNNIEAFVETDSMMVAIMNLEVKGDYLVFGMEIENKGQQPLFLDQQKLTKYAHENSFRENDDKFYQEVTKVMTPMQVNEFFKAKKNNAESAAFLLFLVSAAISTYDAIKDESDNKKSHWTREDEKKSRNRDFIAATTLLATDVLSDVALQNSHNVGTEPHYFPKELFDRKIIYPGESYYGKVLFKKYGSLKKHHRITFPVDGNIFQFDFRKATYKERKFLLQTIK